MLKNFSSDLKVRGFAWLSTALVTVFGMQLLRLLFVGFVGYLRDSLDIGSLDLAPIAIGVFALSFLAGLLNRFAGTRNAMWVTAGGVGLVRLVEQFVQTAQLDLALSIIGVALFLMSIPIAIGAARSAGGDAAANLGFGFLFGLALDSAIFVGVRTLDLSWQPDFLATGLVVILAGALLWSLNRHIKTITAASDASWRRNLNLLAFGPWLFLQMLVFQNVGLFASLTDFTLPVAGALLVLGNAAGLWLASRVTITVAKPLNILVSAMVVLVPLAFIVQLPTFLPWLWLFVGQAFSLALGMMLFTAVGAEKGKAGLIGSTILNGLGQIIFVLLVFVYYASYDIDFGVRSGTLLPLALVLSAVFMAIGHIRLERKPETPKRIFSPAVLGLFLLVFPLVEATNWSAQEISPAPTGTRSVRIINYNLHDAVNTEGRVDPEALAQVIEASGADVIGLQEVSRGWLIWGGMDMLSWLSQRLGMEYVWGPTADPQWGLAVFSRYPIVRSELIPLPPDDILLLRGHILAEIDVDGQILTVIDTHFSEKDDQDEVRAIQSSAILSTWNNLHATVIMGDLNARPDSLAVELLLEAGLIDISREIGEQPTYTYYAANPDHQIDYIFVTPDLGYSDFSIPQTTASDHLPLVTTVILSE
jgi:endonuclease/exonuclease/phosphatase family metal-dependent hydrolase